MKKLANQILNFNKSAGVKKSILFFMFLCCIFISTAQPPTVQWAGVINPDAYGGFTETDAAGNIYVAGHFGSTCDFDLGAGTTNLTPVTPWDIYLAKYNSAGALQWAVSIGGFGTDQITSITLDPSNNILIGGTFTSTADFDPGAGTYNLTALGSVDGFVAKYSNSGAFIWAFALGGSSALGNTDAVNDIDCDASGNVFVTGKMRGTVDFNPDPSLTNIYTHAAGAAFFAKYNAAGQYQFAYTYLGAVGAGSGTNSGYSIFIDNAQNFYITGELAGTNIDLNPGPGSTIITQNSHYFFSKFTNTGTFIWGFGANITSGSGSGYAIYEDSNGDILLTGRLSGTLDFDPTAATYSLTSNGANGSDVFVSKYSSAGALQWAFNFGGNHVFGERGYTIHTNSNNDIILTGNVYDLVDANPGAGVATIGIAATNTGFIAHYSATGVYIWSYTTSSASNASITDASGNYIFTSALNGTYDFDFGAPTNNVTGTNAMAIARYGASVCNYPDIPVINASNNPICTGGSTTLSITSGNLNDASNWYWYYGTCGGTSIGTGTSITVSPAGTTTYYARGEGGCVVPASCGSQAVTVNPILTYYEDYDNDGFGNASITQLTCTGPPAGYVPNSTDCNDSNNAIPYTSNLQYRTVQSGNWTAASTWEKFDGCSWTPATTFPTSAAGAITIQNTHAVIINSGITVNEVTVQSGATLSITAGTTSLSGANSIVMQSGSTINWSNSTINGSGSLQVDAGAIANLTAGFTLTDVNFNNNGTTNWSSGHWYATTGTINNYGILNISSDGDLGSPVWFGTTNFTNHSTGIVNKTGSSADETAFAGHNNNTNNYVVNNGTININSGNLNFNKQFSNTGAINISAGCVARFTGNQDNAYFGAGTSFSGPGSINIEKWYDNNSIWMGMSFGTPITIATNTVNLISGAVQGNGQTLTFGSGSTVNWSGGMFIGTISVINNSNNFNMSSTGSHGMCQTFTNNGTINWTGAGEITNASNGLGNATTTVNFHNYGTFNIVNTDADVTSGNSLVMVFNNYSSGIVTKTGSSSQSTAFYGTFFTCYNNGAINITSGNLLFGGTFADYGSIHIPAASNVTVLGTGPTNGTTFYTYSSTSFTGGGTLNLTGNYLTVIPISTTNIGNITVAYNAPNSRIYGGSMNVLSTFIWTTGSINGVNFSIQSSGTLITNGDVELKESTTLTNYGTWNWINGNITATSVFSIGSDVNNVNNLGTWNLCGGAYTVVNYTTSNVVNIGTMNGLANFGTAGATPPANMIFSNSGTITIGTCGFYPNIPNYITSFATYSPMCAGASINVSYITGFAFGTSNIFSVQLSDASGSFAAPVSIGTLTSSASTGVIPVTIPLGTTPGTGYRLRVVSTTPGYTGIDNGSNFTISAPNVVPTSITADASNNNICSGNSTNLSIVGGSLGVGADWKWYSASCGVALIGTGAGISVSPVTTSSYYVRAEGGCNTTVCESITITVSTLPVTSNAIVPFAGMPANVCNGTTATISIPAVTKATFYVWDAPTGSYFNGNVLNVSPYTTTTPSVTVTFGNPSGSLYNVGVQAGNACGLSLRQAQKVRGSTSVPASITGVLTACANTVRNYSTASVTGASSYLWTITGDATVTGTGTTVTVNFGPAWTGGTLCVASQTSCYTSPTKCINIGASAAALGAISGTFTACPNTTISYSVPASSGAASYTWTLPSGSTGSSNTNSISVSFGAGYSTSGNICVSVTSICGVTSAVKCKTVAPGLPAQPSSISGPSNGLCGQSVVNTCPSQGTGITYTWVAPSGATVISGQGSTSVNIQYATFTTGNLCVTASNTCGSSTTRCIAVKGAPASPQAITATPGSWCANTAGIEFTANVANVSGAYALSWLYPSVPVATYTFGGGNASSLILDWLSGAGTINVTAFNSCGSGTKSTTWSNTCREVETGTVNALTVSPNPTTGVVYLNYTAQKGNTVINVLDLAGRVVFTQSQSSVEGINNTQLDMSKLAKGAYMLHVQSTQGNKLVKVVVE